MDRHRQLVGVEAKASSAVANKRLNARATSTKLETHRSSYPLVYSKPKSWEITRKTMTTSGMVLVLVVVKVVMMKMMMMMMVVLM